MVGPLNLKPDFSFLLPLATLPSATYFFSTAKKSKQKMPSLKCREG
jgi:hypothetical protein